MKRKRDPLFWVAMRIQRALADRAGPVSPDHPIERLLERQSMVRRAWERLFTARCHGWSLVADRLYEPLLMHIRILGDEAEEVLARAGQPRRQIPTLSDLLAELRQLSDEFDHVEAIQGKLVAPTPRIELEGLALGRFAIELRLDRMQHCAPGIRWFDCLALEPHPAARNDAVTHPHVSDRALCAGDATVPLTTALSQGRIADAFCLIQSVLQTYNRSSPYVPISQWNGATCHDCDEFCQSGDLNHCEGCENDVCDDCYSICDVCDQSRCRSCLERDRVSGRHCCSDCRSNCSECGRVVDSDSFDSETERCPECAAKQDNENSKNPSPEIEHASETPEPQPAPVA